LGRKIAELRRLRGFTQAQISELANVSLGYWQAIERGTENLSVRSLVRLSKVLGVNVGTLFEQPRLKTPRRTGRPRKT